MKLVYMLIPIMFITGCVSNLKEGQAVAVETRTVGLDLSVPVPFTHYNLANIKVGWVEQKTIMTNKVGVKSDSEMLNMALIKGEGTIKRKLELEIK